MKILVAPENEHVVKALASDLTNRKYVVEVANDGQLAWQLLEVFSYDLLLLDVSLPKLNGISLCQQLRSCGYSMPVMMLSDQDVSESKVIGLDAGADDYVVKPVDLQELAARIRALLRRGNSTLPTNTVQLRLSGRNFRLCRDAKIRAST